MTNALPIPVTSQSRSSASNDEAAARREAYEELGVSLQALERVAHLVEPRSQSRANCRRQARGLDPRAAIAKAGIIQALERLAPDGCVTPSIALFVASERGWTYTPCRLGSFATVGHWPSITVFGMKTVIHVAAKIARAMKPGARADKDTPSEPFWAVVTGRSTAIRSGVIIP